MLCASVSAQSALSYGDHTCHFDLRVGVGPQITFFVPKIRTVEQGLDQTVILYHASNKVYDASKYLQRAGEPIGAGLSGTARYIALWMTKSTINPTPRPPSPPLAARCRGHGWPLKITTASKHSRYGSHTICKPGRRKGLWRKAWFSDRKSHRMFVIRPIPNLRAQRHFSVSRVKSHNILSPSSPPPPPSLTPFDAFPSYPRELLTQLEGFFRSSCMMNRTWC